MKRYFIVITVILCGCASTQMASKTEDSKAKNFPSPGKKAVVYIYRSGFWGSAVAPTILVNGVKVGTLPTKTFARVVLTKAKNQISVAESSDAENGTVSLIAKSGGIYFARVQIGFGLFSNSWKIQSVDESEGRDSVASCDLIRTTGPIRMPSQANP